MRVLKNAGTSQVESRNLGLLAAEKFKEMDENRKAECFGFLLETLVDYDILSLPTICSLIDCHVTREE